MANEQKLSSDRIVQKFNEMQVKNESCRLEILEQSIRENLSWGQSFPLLISSREQLFTQIELQTILEKVVDDPTKFSISYDYEMPAPKDGTPPFIVIKLVKPPIQARVGIMRPVEAKTPKEEEGKKLTMDEILKGHESVKQKNFQERKKLVKQFSAQIKDELLAATKFPVQFRVRECFNLTQKEAQEAFELAVEEPQKFKIGIGGLGYWYLNINLD
jgi:hypothetical protein